MEKTNWTGEAVSKILQLAEGREGGGLEGWRAERFKASRFPPWRWCRIEKRAVPDGSLNTMVHKPAKKTRQMKPRLIEMYNTRTANINSTIPSLSASV